MINNKEKIVEVKEVDRVAKVGEWIKIVHCGDDRYKNGDILKVIENYDSTSGVDAKMKSSNRTFYICGDEYVVLENYKPKKKKKKSKWEIGNPTKEGNYYVTLSDKENNSFTAVLSRDEIFSEGFRVLAWMKLPKKYKEKGLV